MLIVGENFLLYSVYPICWLAAQTSVVFLRLGDEVLKFFNLPLSHAEQGGRAGDALIEGCKWSWWAVGGQGCCQAGGKCAVWAVLWATVGELTIYGLAKAVGKYLNSRRAEQALVEYFGFEGDRIRVRTARGWVKKVGFSHSEVEEGVYVDGHEREDVVRYCWRSIPYNQKLLIDLYGEGRPQPRYSEGIFEGL